MRYTCVALILAAGACAQPVPVNESVVRPALETTCQKPSSQDVVSRPREFVGVWHVYGRSIDLMSGGDFRFENHRGRWFYSAQEPSQLLLVTDSSVVHCIPATLTGNTARIAGQVRR